MKKVLILYSGDSPKIYAIVAYAFWVLRIQLHIPMDNIYIVKEDADLSKFAIDPSWMVFWFNRQRDVDISDTITSHVFADILHFHSYIRRTYPEETSTLVFPSLLFGTINKSLVELTNNYTWLKVYDDDIHFRGDVGQMIAKGTLWDDMRHTLKPLTGEEVCVADIFETINAHIALMLKDDTEDTERVLKLYPFTDMLNDKAQWTFDNLCNLIDMVVPEDPNRWVPYQKILRMREYWNTFVTGCSLYCIDPNNVAFWFKIFNGYQPVPVVASVQVEDIPVGMETPEESDIMDVEPPAVKEEAIAPIDMVPSFQNQVFQDGCAIRDYVHRMEQLRVRHCGYPLLLSIPTEDETEPFQVHTLAVNSTHGDIQQMPMWSADRHDAYMFYSDLDNTRVLISILFDIAQDKYELVRAWVHSVAHRNNQGEVLFLEENLLGDEVIRLHMTTVVSPETWNAIKKGSIQPRYLSGHVPTDHLNNG